MKTTLLTLAFLLIAQTSQAASWSPEMKKTISDQCVAQNSNLGAKAKPFCDCYTDKITKKYDITQMASASHDELDRITKECISKYVN